MIQQQFSLDFQWPTQEPFLSCVHHYDFFPKGNARWGPPPESLVGRAMGQDFVVKDGFRMYHGDVVPGFPVHPHRGFETVTIVRKGYVDHADSLGAAGRYGQGDVQWMTAGRGIQHSEMFPLLRQDADNTLELFQIWLNLPSKSKMTDPYFKMLWSEQIPRVGLKDNGGQLTLIAGSYEGVSALTPPPESWASQPGSDVQIWLLKLQPGAEFEVSPANIGTTRTLTELKLLSQSPMKFRRQILAFKQFFQTKGATVLLLDDKTSSISDQEVQSIVHGILQMEQLSPEYGSERRRLSILKLRGVAFRGGYHDFTIKKGGIRIFPRLVAAEHGVDIDREFISSGVDGMDRLIGGGVERGSSTLVMGPAGSGKSSVVLQYAAQAASKGDRAAVFTFDEGERTVINRSKGSVFDITVSFRKQPGSNISTSARYQEKASLSLVKAKPLLNRRILLVDDSKDNRTLIGRMLKLSGADVKTADDGVQGVQKAMSGDFDVVLMDIQMPRLGGHEATLHLRDKGYSKPVIALTAHALQDDRDKCLAAGCSDYLTKPVNRSELIQTLLNHV